MLVEFAGAAQEGSYILERLPHQASYHSMDISDPGPLEVYL